MRKEDIAAQLEPTPSGSTLKTKTYRGKGSKAKSTEKFRLKVGRKQLQDRKDEISKRWGFSMSDDMEEVTKSLDAIHVPVVQRARPMPIATRGIGVAAAIEYMKMTATWNFNAISEICSIHQYYRVTLHLLYARCVEAFSTQTNSEAYSRTHVKTLLHGGTAPLFLRPDFEGSNLHCDHSFIHWPH